MPTSTSVEHTASQVGSVSSYPDVNHQSRLLPFCLPTPPAPPPHPAPLRIWAPLSSGVLKEKRASACRSCHEQTAEDGGSRQESRWIEARGLLPKQCTHTHTLHFGPGTSCCPFPETVWADSLLLSLSWIRCILQSSWELRGKQWG